MTREELLAIVAAARQVGKSPDLSGASLDGADLRDVDLGDAKLQNADLCESDLRGAYLRWANLEGANLQDACLEGADLLGASLSNADLRGAVLPHGWTIRQWSGAGRYRRQTTLAVRPEGHVVWCGCFTGSVDEFAAAIERTHADNMLHLEDYQEIVESMRRIIAREVSRG